MSSRDFNCFRGLRRNFSRPHQDAGKIMKKNKEIRSILDTNACSNVEFHHLIHQSYRLPVAKSKLLVKHLSKIKPQSFKKFRLQRHCQKKPLYVKSSGMTDDYKLHSHFFGTKTEYRWLKSVKQSSKSSRRNQVKEPRN